MTRTASAAPTSDSAACSAFSWRETLPGPIPNSYLRVEEAGKSHPLLKGFADADLLIAGAYQLRVEPTASLGAPLLTVIPQYPSLPMEKNYWRVQKTEIPAVFARESGKGPRGRVYWEVLVDDHGRLLRNAVDWALNEERPVTVAGLGVLDVTVWKQKDSMTAHLVNLTNPMMMRPSFGETIPLGPYEVKLQLPAGQRAGAVKFLVGSATPQVERSGGSIALTVPSIGAHEVIAVDLA